MLRKYLPTVDEALKAVNDCLFSPVGVIFLFPRDLSSFHPSPNTKIDVNLLNDDR